jgi:hypothetical protein
VYWDTRVSQYTCQTGLTWIFKILVSNRFDTCIEIHVSNLTRVSQYTCQIVQLMTCTSDTRLTRVKMHVSNCLTRVQHCTRVKLHMAICMHFCSVFWSDSILFDKIDQMPRFSLSMISIFSFHFYFAAASKRLVALATNECKIIGCRL